MLKLGQMELDGTPRLAVGYNDSSPQAAIDEADKHGVDIAEIRIDQFDRYDVDYVVRQVRRFSTLPTIATVRIPDEGGDWAGSESDRLSLIRTVLPHVDAIDIELSASSILEEAIGEAHGAGKLAVVSFHDVEATPSRAQLEATKNESLAAGADIVKVATRVRGAEDIHALSGLLSDNRDSNLVVIGMGGEGLLTRVLFPALGSLITFAYVGKPSAPGQLAIGEMSDLMRLFYPAYNARMIALGQLEYA